MAGRGRESGSEKRKRKASGMKVEEREEKPGARCAASSARVMPVMAWKQPPETTRSQHIVQLPAPKPRSRRPAFHHPPPTSLTRSCSCFCLGFSPPPPGTCRRLGATGGSGPLAAWMPPTSLHGWIHGVSRSAGSPKAHAQSKRADPHRRPTKKTTDTEPKTSGRQAATTPPPPSPPDRGSPLPKAKPARCPPWVPANRSDGITPS